MTCRRICRELLWLTRFGHIDQDSAPHLEHLAECHACRDEVGFDRAMVQQLRLALAERVGDVTPSPAAWDGVLDRMRKPDPRTVRVRAWMVRLAAGLRAGTAMAGASLALIVTLNLEVVSIIPPGLITETEQPGPAAIGQGVRPDSTRPWVEVEPIAPAPAAADPVAAPRTAVQPVEQLPIVFFGGNVVNAEANPVESTDGPDAVDEPLDVWQVLQVRLLPADRVGMRGGGSQSAETDSEEPEPVPAPPLDGPS
jgi:hypothetical protein